MLKDHIKIEDFKGYKFLISIKNETSQTSFVDNEINKAKVKIISIEDDQITIETPNTYFSIGHQIILAIEEYKEPFKAKRNFPLKESENLILLSCKVVDKKDLDVGRVESHLKLTQFNSEKWKKLLTQINKNKSIQEDIFLKGQ